ncbi:MAG: V-type ATP synthase subunit F [Parcubacteria group bacterium CG11_big_fil_rev_8_21_14_0_20_39_22]|nr:MAG: V-type ATP synthase subunit F [Parcubacteria group bacterium CG11_big_fil_rev_8_21_14_0_20_39_22]
MSNIEYKIAVVGPKSVVSIFKSVGADVFSVENGDKAVEILKKIKKDTASGIAGRKYATVVLLESIAKDIKSEEYEKVSEGDLPAVVVVPGIEGSSGMTFLKLKKMAERAVGMDILK